MKKTIAALAMLPALSVAAPITDISATISGDIRYPNISDAIDVRMEGTQRVGDVSIFDFNVGFSANMLATQPSAKMQQFYFNLNPDSEVQWDITGLTTGWSADFDPSPIPGAGNGGSITFTYGLDAPGGGVTATDLPLEFALQLFDLDGITPIEIMDTNFLDAGTSVGDGGSGQTGVKVGGLLGSDGGQDLSGFGYGNYQVACIGDSCGGGGSGGGDPIPEPGMISLLSLGLIGLFVSRRRNRLGMA